MKGAPGVGGLGEMPFSLVQACWETRSDLSKSQPPGKWGPGEHLSAFIFSAFVGFALTLQGPVHGFGKTAARADVSPSTSSGAEGTRSVLWLPQSLAPIWPRPPPREGQWPSEHFIFPVMPATKNNTHLPCSTRKSRDFSPAATPAASSPYPPAWPLPSPCLLSPPAPFRPEESG